MSNTPSVPVSHQVRDAEDDLRPGTVTPTSKSFYYPGAADTAALDTYQIEIRYGPTMMSANAEIKAADVDGVFEAVVRQGGIRLTSKLASSTPGGGTFQLGGFVTVQSIHSILVSGKS